LAQGGVEAGEASDGTVDAETAEARCAVRVLRPTLWAAGAAYLYRLRLEALDADGAPIDSYEQRLGLRTVEASDDGLLLNGEPVAMRGFGRHEDFPLVGRSRHISPYLPVPPSGRHEDFPLVGRAEVGAVLVRDHACLRWVGANSYRTAHYPYSELDLDLADEHGGLV